MKIVAIAKNHCANYLSDGTCNGVDFKRPKLIQFRFLPEGIKCLLACGRSCKCRYFETAVLPQLTKAEANIYLKRSEPLPEPKPRVCPDCGEELLYRMRYCSFCSRMRKRYAHDPSLRQLWRTKKMRPKP